jgi:hypothetical protein
MYNIHYTLNSNVHAAMLQSKVLYVIVIIITTNAANASSAADACTPGTAPLLTPPLLVLPPRRLFPFMPLLVASTAGSMVTELPAPVTVLVANVAGAADASAPELASAASERKTSANDGAGSVMLHVFDAPSHGTVVTFTVPMGRPSEPNVGPKF